MRLRAAAAPLALVLALLTACSAESSLEDFEALRAALDAAEGVHIAARVAAAGERPEEYTLTLEGTAADCTVTVVEPEALAGVSAHITENGAEIGYGPLLLAAGDLDGAGLSAITALPRLLAAISGAHAALSWTEGEGSAVSLVPADGEGIELRLGPDGRPLSAEFTAGGEVLVMCEIEGFSLTAT